jgi:hypothetical protein
MGFAYGTPKGKFMRYLLALNLLLLTLAAGCASVGIRDSSLELEIQPLPLERGKPALARVNAPMDAEKVVGIVKTFGSPQLLFNPDKKKGIWYFYGTIPFSPWVKPGSYVVQVLVHQGDSRPHYTEMKVELK